MDKSFNLLVSSLILSLRRLCLTLAPVVWWETHCMVRQKIEPPVLGWLPSDLRNLENCLPSIQSQHRGLSFDPTLPSNPFLQGNKSTQERKYLDFERMITKRKVFRNISTWQIKRQMQFHGLRETTTVLIQYTASWSFIWSLDLNQIRDETNSLLFRNAVWLSAPLTMGLYWKGQQEGTENVVNLDLCACLEVFRAHALIKIHNYIFLHSIFHNSDTFLSTLIIFRELPNIIKIHI